jgi:hypothetical protein
VRRTAATRAARRGTALDKETLTTPGCLPMIEPTTITRPLSSANHLAAFHARRERFYSVTAQLLAGPPDEHRLETARRLMARAALGCRDLIAALGDSRHHAAASEHLLLFPASGGDGDGLVAALNRLGTLAYRVAVALQAGDMADAAAVSDEQAHFLHDQAGRLADHAQRIAGAGGPFHRALGTALAQQLADDVRLLADEHRPGR